MRVAPLAGPASGCQSILRSCAQPAGAIARPHLPSSRPYSDATSSTCCSALDHSRQTCRRPSTALAAAAATEEAAAGATGQLPAACANVEAAPGNGALLLAEDHEWAPEAFTLQPGEVGPVDRHSESGEPAEAFRCAGCTRSECQVTGKPTAPIDKLSGCRLMRDAYETLSLSISCCHRDRQVAPLLTGARLCQHSTITCGRS